MKAKKGDVQPTTYSNKFGLYKNHILPIFGELMLSSITRIQIHEWVNQLLEDNYSMETIKPLKGMLYSILELAVSDR